MKYKRIRTLTEILNLSYGKMSYEERVKLRYEHVQKHPEEEHWDYIEYWEHHSKRKSDPELLLFTDVCVSTFGRTLLYDIKARKFEIDEGIRLGNYRGKVVRENGTKYQLYLHRAVCSTFLPNTDLNLEIGYPGYDVNHKDLNKQNNPLTNLEWMTPSENCLHNWKEKGFNRNKDRILEIKCDLPGIYHNKIYYLKSPVYAKRLGFNDIAISQVLFNGERHKGCTWKYVDPQEDITFGIPEDALAYILSTKTNMGNAKPVVGTIQVPGEHYGEEFLLIGTEDLKRYGFGQGNVANVCLGNKEKAYKCKWRYVEESDTGAYQMGLTPEQRKILFKN